MKKTEKLLAVLIALASCFAANADVHHDVTVGTKVTHFDYSTYTYTYIDVNGVEQTANLIDEATDPNQIIALLKKVYTDPTIPGIRYAYDYKDDEGQPYQRKHLNYNVNASHGTPWTRTNGEVVANPNDDGMTMLVVQVKDSYKKSMHTGSDWNKIDVAIQSVKLVKNFTRVNDETNPGYLMSIAGISTNRFFFLSKGKPRATYLSPFYMTYEQISPVNYATASETTNFINEITAGHSYPCIHDCGQVINYDPGHWFTIDKSGENYSLNNLTIFMPDRRFEYNLDPNENVADDHANGEVYKNYGRTGTDTDPFNPVIAPKVLMYTADLNAVATPSNYSTGDDRSYYDVNLDWSTSFTEEKIGVDVPQHFYVYIVNEDGSRTLIQDVEKDTNGMVRVHNHSYTVEQTDETQTLRYVITAHTINYDNDGRILLTQDGDPYITISAESTVRTVTIPGLKNAFFTELSEYRSRYYVENASKQYNIYRNTVSISPTNALEFSRINTADKAYRLCRKLIKNGNVSETSERVIAQITFTPSAYDNNVVTVNDYSIIYKNLKDSVTQEVTPVYLFDENTPTDLEVSGTITIDEPVIVLYDRFIESTISNNQDEGYAYYLKGLVNTNYIERSDRFNVPVYKTENIVSGEGRTHDEVVADVDHSAKATPDNTITFKAINDPAANLVDYEIRRLRQNNFKYFTKIGKAENYNNSGQYYIYALNDAGQLNELVNIESVGTEGGNITTHDINSSSDNLTSSYVPVINTLYNGDASRPNSYGCDIQRTGYPGVELSIPAMEKTNPFYGNDGPLMGYRVNLKISPKLPSANVSNINFVYYYRVWREIDGTVNPTRIEGEKMVNHEQNQSGEGINPNTGVLTPWASDYDCLHVTYPGQTDVEVNDLFVDCAYDGTKKVTYIVRLYATSVYGQQGAGLDQGGKGETEGGSGKDYFIAEAKKVVTFDNSTPTAIGTVNAEAKVISVTYYNMMGVASNRPYPGINIVEKRYSNGATTTSKVVY